MELRDQAYATAGDDRLSEPHVVHAIIHQHRDVVDLDNLIPQVGQQAQGQIPMSNGALVGTLLLGTLHIDMNPLVVECGISKQVDAILVHLQPVGSTQFLAQMGGKLVVRVDN